MQESSIGRIGPAFHKLCQLQKLVVNFNSVLVEREFQKKYLELNYIPSINETIADCVETVTKMKGDAVDQKSGLISTISEQYKKMIDKKSAQLRKLLATKTNALQEKTKMWREELNDMNMEAKQIKHNLNTSINAIDIQTKETNGSILTAVKRSEIKLAQDKTEYSQQMQNKIAILQEKANKVVKNLTEIHVNNQNRIQKEFANNILNISVLPNLNQRKLKKSKSQIKMLKNQILSMKKSIYLLIDANHNHSENLKGQLSKICEQMKDELEVSTTNDIHNCKIFTKLDESLKNCISDIKSNNNLVIIAKMGEINDLEKVKESNAIKYQEILTNKQEEIKKCKENENQIIDDLKNDLIKKIERVQEENAKNAVEIEQNIENLKDKLKNPPIFESFVYENEDFSAKIENMKQYFADEIELENSSFKVKCETIENACSVEQIRLGEKIDHAVSVLSELQKNKAIFPGDLISESEADRSLIEDEEKKQYEELNVRLNHEYDSKIISVQQEIQEFEKKCQNEEINFAEKVEKNYLQNIKNITIMLSTNNIEVKTKEKEYRSIFETEESNLAQIPEIHKINSDHFERTDRMIESLNHKCFQLKSTVKIQRAAFISECVSTIEAEDERYQKKLREFSEKLHEMMELRQLLSDVKISKIKEEGQLMNALNHLRNDHKMIIENFEKKKVEVSQFEKFALFDNLLKEIKRDSHFQITTKTNEANQEINGLTKLIIDVNNNKKNEKVQIEADMIRIRNEIIEYQSNKSRRINQIRNDLEYEMKKEAENYNQTMSRQNLLFEDQKTELVKMIKFYQKNIANGENNHFFSFNQHLSQNNLAVEEFSKMNRNYLEKLKSEFIGLREFAKEQIEVLQMRLNNRIKEFNSRPPRECDKKQIESLEKQVEGVSRKLQVVLKEYGETKNLMVAKEKEYNHRFGISPKIGTYKTKNVCVRKAYA